MERDEKVIIMEAILDTILKGQPDQLPEDGEPVDFAGNEKSSMEHVRMNDYPRIIDKLKTSKLVQTLSSKAAPKPEKQRCMHSFNHEEWVADEYRDNMQELRNRLSNIAAQLHETTVALVRANLRIQELEEENTILRSGNQQ